MKSVETFCQVYLLIVISVLDMSVFFACFITRFMGSKLEFVLDTGVSLLWHSRLWSFQRRDTKLERFLAKNQLYSNEITKF